MTSCPVCASRRVRRSFWRPAEGLRRLLLYQGYRCRDCQHKFWRLNRLKAVVLGGLCVLAAVVVGLYLRPPPGSAGEEQSGIAKLLAQARAGSPTAQLEVGVRYLEGDGVIKNDRTAGRWLQKAAAHGGAEAEFQYALVLLNGRGMVQDYQSAFQWMAKSAHHGYAPAQYQLGQLYQFGTGTPMNKPQAYLWYNLAAAQGVELAVKARDALVWQLSPAQVQAMQQQARNLLRAGAAPGK